MPTDVQLIQNTPRQMPDLGCVVELQSLEFQLKPLLGVSWDAFLKDEDLKCGNDCRKRVAWRSQALAKMRPPQKGAD